MSSRFSDSRPPVPIGRLRFDKLPTCPRRSILQQELRRKQRVQRQHTTRTASKGENWQAANLFLPAVLYIVNYAAALAS
jgi:hypothetical protein